MKKLILASIITIAISSGLSAQTKNTTNTPGTNKDNSGYIDNNKNGVCDNYENNTRQFAGKGQGQGRRGGPGMRNRQGCMNTQCRQSRNGRAQ